MTDQCAGVVSAHTPTGVVVIFVVVGCCGPGLVDDVPTLPGEMTQSSKAAGKQILLQLAPDIRNGFCYSAKGLDGRIRTPGCVGGRPAKGHQDREQWQGPLWDEPLVSLRGAGDWGISAGSSSTETTLVVPESQPKHGILWRQKHSDLATVTCIPCCCVPGYTSRGG